MLSVPPAFIVPPTRYLLERQAENSVCVIGCDAFVCLEADDEKPMRVAVVGFSAAVTVYYTPRRPPSLSDYEPDQIPITNQIPISCQFWWKEMLPDKSVFHSRKTYFCLDSTPV